MKVYNTGETSVELKEKYNPEGSILRRAQLRMLDMLLYIDKICKDNDLEYTLADGNLLGAIRHGGFIPWDDDMDICMDRDNYNKLCNILITSPHPQYVLQNNDTDPGFFGVWSVLRDTKSEYIVDTTLHKIRKYRGLQIDIFPLEENCPVWVHKLAVYAEVIKNKYLLKHKKIAQFYYNIETKIVFPTIRLGCRLVCTTNYYMYPLGTGWHHKLSLSFMRPIGKVMFEGHEFPAPAKIHDFLECIYKNYMDLPAIDQRDHHKAEYRIWE